MSKVQNIEQVIEATIVAHAMLAVSASEPLVLMVSGGSDSVALARLFGSQHKDGSVNAGSRLADDFATPTLPHILHINHMLRGDASERDEQFVRELAAQLGLPCTVRRVDVAALAAAQTNGNVEAVARDVRYAAAEQLLDDLCDAAGAQRSAGRIATAHTLDDRVEMFYMRTIVGGGTGSLASIPYVGGASSRVIRPLLNCTRAQLREWLERDNSYDLLDKHLPLWREDASNADTSKLRAFVRHELLPLATQRNPELLATLRRTMDLLANDAELLDEQAAELYDKYVVSEPAMHTISLALYDDAQAPLPLRRRVIKCALDTWAIALGQQPRQEFRHIDRIARDGNTPGFVLHVAGGIEVRSKRKLLVIQAAKLPRQKAVQC